jgi:hypothetical protein
MWCWSVIKQFTCWRGVKLKHCVLVGEAQKMCGLKNPLSTTTGTVVVKECLGIEKKRKQKDKAFCTLIQRWLGCLAALRLDLTVALNSVTPGFPATLSVSFKQRVSKGGGTLPSILNKELWCVLTLMENYQCPDWLIIPADVSKSLLLSTFQTQKAPYKKLVIGNLSLAYKWQINMNTKYVAGVNTIIWLVKL